MNEQFPPSKEDPISFPGKAWLVLLFAFALVAVYFIALEVNNAEPSLAIENDTTEPTFLQIYIFCNSELNNYTASNVDYLQCDTQDECELKKLRYQILAERNYECFKLFLGDEE